MVGLIITPSKYFNIQEAGRKIKNLNRQKKKQSAQKNKEIVSPTDPR